MSKQHSQLFRILIVMLIVTIVSSGLLGIIYCITKEPIQEAQNRLISEGLKEVIVTEFDNDPFDEKITVRHNKEKFTIFPARKDGYITSIVMKSFSNQGFGGKMEVIVSFLLDGTVGDFKVINHKETPGLGSKVNDLSFRKNVAGLSPNSDSFKVRKDGGEIDAITGATISSRALIDAIQKAYRGYLKFNTGK